MLELLVFFSNYLSPFVFELLATKSELQENTNLQAATYILFEILISCFSYV